MIQMLAHWVLCAFCLFLTAKLIPGFKLNSFGSSMWAAVIVGFFNIFLRPVLMFFAFPINLITLGLFTFVVNAAVLKLSAKFLKGFDIDGWWPAIFGAIALAVLQTIVFTMVPL